MRTQVLLFYNDRASSSVLIDLMENYARSSHLNDQLGTDFDNELFELSPLLYHIELVQLLGNFFRLSVVYNVNWAW